MLKLCRCRPWRLFDGLLGRPYEQMLDLFEVAPEGQVSRKVFIDRMVDIFVQRKSLQLTLGDYEVTSTDRG